MLRAAFLTALLACALSACATIPGDMSPSDARKYERFFAKP